MSTAMTSIPMQPPSPLLRRRRTLRAALAAWLCCASALSLADTATTIFPPWQDGRNNDATHRGLEFTVP